jgi:hypothetical protein
VPRGDPVHGVGIVRDLDVLPGQLVPKSYRPGAGGRRGGGQCGDSLGQLIRPADERLPDSLPSGRVERREDLAAVTVEDRQALTLHARFRHSPPDRIEGADAVRRKTEAGRQPAGGGDADSQPGEGAGAEADGKPVDRLPAAGGVGGPLDLDQQRARVPGLPSGGEPQQRLVQSFAVAPGAGGGVGGRGVEADDDQGKAASSP